jgi:hypothetical protein
VRGSVRVPSRRRARRAALCLGGCRAGAGQLAGDFLQRAVRCGGGSADPALRWFPGPAFHPAAGQVARSERLLTLQAPAGLLGRQRLPLQEEKEWLIIDSMKTFQKKSSVKHFNFDKLLPTRAPMELRTPCLSSFYWICVYRKVPKVLGGARRSHPPPDLKAIIFFLKCVSLSGSMKMN